ncbi:MAG: DEAD/DEAH box helicase [Propionibacteriaceae bacterium]|jgi:ATP-dependent Lhr-like helicase|nr:DEAD/DEAH box helicase [Propionibacteriaceae bacterium]
MTVEALARFSPFTADWFERRFGLPTPAQVEAWAAIGSGRHSLVIAPTGSGKTLAAFLWHLDRLLAAPGGPGWPAAPLLPGVWGGPTAARGDLPAASCRPDDWDDSTDPGQTAPRACRVLYISPLKALAADVERNLSQPLAEIRRLAAARGRRLPTVEVALRTGDTTTDERRRFARRGADVLITTPESLFLLLTSAARRQLTTIETVIVDEIHSLAATKRGAHLALSLERLDARLAAPAQRVGLSATVRPPQAVAEFLAGGRPVTIVAPPTAKRWDLKVELPVPDLADLGHAPPPSRPGGRPGPGGGRRDRVGRAGGRPDRVGRAGEGRDRVGRAGGRPDRGVPGASRADPLDQADGRGAGDEADRADQGTPPASIWPHVTARLAELIEQHHSTIVFVNARQTAERLAARLNEVLELRRAAAEGRQPEIERSGELPANYIAAASVAAAAPAVVMAHHGSMSPERRRQVEEALKAGQLRAVVATSSLELGIDMGAVELVAQVQAPSSVASGLQRIGRAGHQVGAVSKGRFFPQHLGDLVAMTVVVSRMRQGWLEITRIERHPLDVLAQQIVAMAALDDWSVDQLWALVKRAAPFAQLSRRALEAVLDMLSGRYPAEAFAELRPRIDWDRARGRISGRRGAQRLAVTSGGTIPDRGMFKVFWSEGGPGGRRVGELEEEMVFESRVGDTIVLGSSPWRITAITADQVQVVPAPGSAGRMPFWRGDGPGRSAELGQAIGAFVRQLGGGGAGGDHGNNGAEGTAEARVAYWADEAVADRADVTEGDTEAGGDHGNGGVEGAAEAEGDCGAEGAAGAVGARRRLSDLGLDDWAAGNLLAYLEDQRRAAGVVPDDRTIVVESFRDELGDWRVVLLSPWGQRVHLPWSLLIAARLQAVHGIAAQAMAADDGIVFRLPDTAAAGDPEAPAWETGVKPCPSARSEAPTTEQPSTPPSWAGAGLADLLLTDPDQVEDQVRAALADSPHFAARFREAAARSLLLPRRQPGRRQPLWQQRHRSAQLLRIAADHPEFPVMAEAARECLQDDFDLAALKSLMAGLASRRIRLAEVVTPRPSPFARNLLFNYVGLFMYLADTPLAELRAAGLAVDPALLADLLAQGGLAPADLLDPAATNQLERELQSLTPTRQARDAEDVHDLVRRLGPITTAALAERVQPGKVGQLDVWLDQLVAHGAITVWVPRAGGAVERGGVVDRGGASGRGGVVEREGTVECGGGAARCDAGASTAGLGESIGLAGPVGGADPVGSAVAAMGLGESPDREVAVGAAERGGVERGGATPAPRWIASLDADLPLEALVRRYARNRGPFTAVEGAAWLDWPATEVAAVLARLAADGRLERGRLRPGAAGESFCDPAVWVRLKGRSLARLRAAVEPVGAAAYARFLLAWQGVGDPTRRGLDGLRQTVEQLAGLPLPASAWESFILPARVADYQPGLLDQLLAAGEVVWAGRGPLAVGDGWVTLLPAELVEVFPPTPPDPPLTALERQVLDVLAAGGAFRLDEIVRALPLTTAPSDGAGRDGGQSSLDQAVGGTPGGAPSGGRTGVAAGADGGAVVAGRADGGVRGGWNGGGAWAGSAPVADGPPLRDRRSEVLEACWRLAWAGLITSDTLTPLRERLSQVRPTLKSRPRPPRARFGRPRLSLGPVGLGAGVGQLGGRWFRLPTPEPAPPAADPSLGWPPAGSADSTQSAAELDRFASNSARAAAPVSTRPSTSAPGRQSAAVLFRPAAVDPAAAEAEARRAVTRAEVLLDRHGILTRGSLRAENVPGGFAALYRLLALAEDQGRVRRGYYVERLGASQFAAPGAADRLRAQPDDPPTDPAPSADPATSPPLVVPPAGPEVSSPPFPRPPASSYPPASGATAPAAVALLLAATDPASPYGAAVPWPPWPAPPLDSLSASDGADLSAQPVGAEPDPLTVGLSGADRGHQPARKAGALVALINGELAAFVERGGRTVLTWRRDRAGLAAVARAMAAAVHDGRIDRLTVKTIDGRSVLAPSAATAAGLVPALVAAGFILGPHGLRLRR